ncbi:hypothetical protein TGRUB_232560 [Toxoplasma gondii RUB]|uniref:Uncharacterized protein n=1 Tax=Toxoplasma gondii RUB TaxID=935652 RepID=A0A086M4K8_TOXGO|nr:hypothetical protein TGRUB_232560 [Toxoplasma gondii RUB]
MASSTSQAPSSRSSWKRHFETALQRATASADKFLQCSSRVLLSSRENAPSVRGPSSCTDSVSPLSVVSFPRQCGLPSGDAFFRGRPPGNAAQGGSSCGKNASFGYPLVSGTKEASVSAVHSDFISYEETKALARFKGRGREYIPPKLTKDGGVLFGGSGSKVTSQMKRQLECVTVVTKREKVNNILDLTTEASQRTLRNTDLPLCQEPDLGSLYTKQLKEIENAKECLKDIHVQKPWQTWPPKEETLTLVHHTASRNPLSPFTELHDPIENREYADSWRCPAPPSLGSGFRYSEQSGLNSPTPSDAMASWFKHKKADETHDDSAQELSNFVALLHTISEESMKLPPPKKKVQTPTNPLHPLLIRDTAGSADASGAPQPVVLTVVRQEGLKAKLEAIDGDAVSARAAPAAKRKNEKEASVQTADPPPQLKPAEAKSKSPPTSAPKGPKISRTLTDLAVSESSTSESEASPRLVPLSQAMEPVAIVPAELSAAAPAAATSSGVTELGTRSRTPRRASGMELRRKSIQDIERAIAERKARDRYNEYLDLVNGLPRRCLPQLNGDEEDDSSSRNLRQSELSVDLPPWLYFLDTHTTLPEPVGMSTVVPSVMVPRLQDAAFEEDELSAEDLPGFAAFEQLTNLFAPGFKEFLYPEYDPSSASPMAIPMIQLVDPDKVNVWQEVAENALHEEWELTQREWGTPLQAEIEAYQKLERKLFARRKKQARQRVIAERKKDINQDVDLVQRRLRQDIQQQYDEFVSTEAPLQQSMQHELNKGLRAIGSCRGGRRAWAVFNRSIRSEATQRREASPSYKRRLEEDAFGFVPPPAVGRRCGRQATRAGRGRMPGGHARASETVSSQKGEDKSTAMGDRGRKGAGGAGQRREPIEDESSLTSEEMENQAVDLLRQRDLDRMLQDAASQIRPDFGKRVASPPAKVEQTRLSSPADGSLQQHDADNGFHVRMLQQRMRASEVATKIENTSSLVAYGEVPSQVKELFGHEVNRLPNSAGSVSENAFVGLLGSHIPHEVGPSAVSDSKTRGSSAGRLICQASQSKSASSQPCIGGSDPLNVDGNERRDSRSGIAQGLERVPTPTEADSDFEEANRDEDAFCPLPTLGRHIDASDYERQPESMEVITSKDAIDVTLHSANLRDKQSCRWTQVPSLPCDEHSFHEEPTQEELQVDCHVSLNRHDSHDEAQTSSPSCRSGKGRLLCSRSAIGDSGNDENEGKCRSMCESGHAVRCVGARRSGRCQASRLSKIDKECDADKCGFDATKDGTSFSPRSFQTLINEEKQGQIPHAKGKRFGETASELDEPGTSSVAHEGVFDSPSSYISTISPRSPRGQQALVKTDSFQSVPRKHAFSKEDVRQCPGQRQGSPVPRDLGKLEHSLQESSEVVEVTRRGTTNAPGEEQGVTSRSSVTTESDFNHQKQLLYKQKPHLRSLFRPLSAERVRRPSKFPWDDEVIPTCRAQGETPVLSLGEDPSYAKDHLCNFNSSPRTREKSRTERGASATNSFCGTSGRETPPGQQEWPCIHHSPQRQSQPFLRRGCGEGGGRYHKRHESNRKRPPVRNELTVSPRNQTQLEVCNSAETVSGLKLSPFKEEIGVGNYRKSSPRDAATVFDIQSSRSASDLCTVSISGGSADSMIDFPVLWPSIRSLYKSSECSRRCRKSPSDRNPLVCIDEANRWDGTQDRSKPHEFLKKGSGRCAGQSKQKEESSATSRPTTPRHASTAGGASPRVEPEDILSATGEGRTRVCMRFEKGERNSTPGSQSVATERASSGSLKRSSSEDAGRRAGEKDKVPYTRLVDLSSHFQRPRVRWGNPISQAFCE